VGREDLVTFHLSLCSLQLCRSLCCRFHKKKNTYLQSCILMSKGCGKVCR
jgi:hypothetical protein